MNKIEIFEKYLEESESVMLFEKFIENGTGYYKSCFKNKLGEFNYFVLIHPTPVVEVICNVLKISGDKAKSIVLEYINELNIRTKGIKYLLDRNGNVEVCYEFIGTEEDFDPEDVLGTALAFFNTIERDVAQLVVVLEKEKNKDQNLN